MTLALFINVLIIIIIIIITTKVLFEVTRDLEAPINKWKYLGNGAR